MVVLAYILAETTGGREAEIGATIVDIRNEWLLNDTEGPVAELLENRLLGFSISQTEVPLKISEARRIFDEELCLNGRSSPTSEIPILDLRLLVDNWDATAPGQSFLTDSRNSRTAEGHWVVSADAAQQYKDGVQRFLRALLVPFFIRLG
ncbi:uncharacterized protein N7498_007935 [Penicillium cinerascens]|uniref:Uncharacterized protein n=1 Tax=Penicillium cinerascens TaxID=70096 RepID=A0A9W9MBS3_9EURO|nr:uncharacterized protein N7498_007935 [Penicillium cinerascens]KAJ5194497.1 hypothetical protein N7498_007935 [Penicillium cinerascens]